VLVPLLVYLVGPTGAEAFVDATGDETLADLAWAAFWVQVAASGVIGVALSWRGRKKSRPKHDPRPPAVRAIAKIARDRLPSLERVVFWLSMAGLAVAIAATVASQVVSGLEVCEQASPQVLTGALLLESAFMLVGSIVVLAPWLRPLQTGDPSGAAQIAPPVDP
jgi:hypothetical protein